MEHRVKTDKHDVFSIASRYSKPSNELIWWKCVRILLYLKFYLSDFYKCFVGKCTHPSFRPQSRLSLRWQQRRPYCYPQNKILQGCNQSIAHNFHCYSSNIKKRNISWTKEKWLYRHIRHSHHYYFARELSSPTLIISFFQLIK